MNEDQMKAITKKFRERLGGTVFAFPIEEDNPFSSYAVVVYAGNEYFIYPKASDISLAATGVTTILELLIKEGLAKSYENDVRFISYQPQVDAPSVTMRRLKKGVNYAR